jgi:DNA polymerase I-like protein with 3'-5' exonuclease and polymerase domains
VTGHAPPELRPVLDVLKGRKPEIMAILGATERDQPPIDLLASLGITPVVPATIEETETLLAELIEDSLKITPAGVRKYNGVWLGCDSETTALPGEEERPPAHLRLKDGLPAKNQPSLKKLRAPLDPHRSRIRLVQLYGGGQRCLVLDTDVVPLGVLAPVLTKHTLILHNASFELRFFAEAGIEVAHFEDTMQAAGLLLGVQRRSLEEGVRAYLGIDLPKGHQTSDWGASILSGGQIAYAALDGVAPFQLWRKLRVELHQKGRSAAYTLQRDVTAPTVRMIRRGITLDLRAHARKVVQWEADAAEARASFLTETGKAPPWTPAETRAFLTEVLPPEVIARWPLTTKTGELTTEGAELKRHVDVPAIRALLALNAMLKLHGTFGPELAKKVSARTGKLHPRYNVASTKAGRFSCNDPNIQQIPKHKAAGLRSCFVAETGKVFIISDYNMMELREAAEESNDEVMRADFAAGKDLHHLQAASMLHLPEDAEITKDQRDAAKPINFGTISARLFRPYHSHSVRATQAPVNMRIRLIVHPPP